MRFSNWFFFRFPYLVIIIIIIIYSILRVSGERKKKRFSPLSRLTAHAVITRRRCQRYFINREMVFVTAVQFSYKTKLFKLFVVVLNFLIKVSDVLKYLVTTPLRFFFLCHSKKSSFKRHLLKCLHITGCISAPNICRDRPNYKQ